MRAGPRAAFGALLLLLPPALARADDTARIEALEREVSDLKALVEDLQAERSAAPPPTHGMMDHGPAPGAAASAGWSPTLDLRGFGHMQYDIDTQPAAGESGTNHFTDGAMDLLITSEVAPKVGFLAETLFEFESGGETVIDVERLLLKYDYSDALELGLGRGHTALGYWNHRYHHGTWLYTSTDRPLLFRFEDDGGILPVHFVGLELGGNLETAPGLFSYVFNVANGRGQITDEVQLVEDQNDSKMLAGMLRFAPDAVPGLAFGVNALLDEIPPQPGNPARADSIGEIIAGFHVVYTESPFEILLESQYIHHQDGTSHRAYDSWGGYFQAGYRVGRLTPYYRFDWLGIAEGDPFYAGVPGVEDSTQHVLGVRFDWRTFVALKLEYRRLLARSFDSNAFTAQVSFAF
jgi:hypothetical protein